MSGLVLWWFVSTWLRSPATVAELAWRESWRRLAIGPAVVSLTNESLPAAEPRPVDMSGSQTQGSPARPASVEGEASRWWRVRMDAARARVEQARTALEGIEAQLSALARDIAAQDDPVQQQRLLRERQVSLLERETMVASLEQAQAAVAAVEEAARRAAIPPGWIR